MSFIISLAQGYEKALEIVAEIVKSKGAAINLVTDAVTYPLIPSCDDTIAITFFPHPNKHIYGNGVYSIATHWELSLIYDNPLDAIREA